MLPIESIAAIPSVLLRRELNFKVISLIDFVAALIGSFAVLTLALEGFGVWSLVLGSLIKSTVNTLGLLFATGFRTVPLFRFFGLAGIFSFGAKVSGSGIIWYFSQNIDVALVGKLLGGQALGLYSVANNLAFIPVTKVMQLAQQVAFAGYARVQNDREIVNKYLLKSMRLASFIFFPACWGMSAITADLVDVALGPKWHPAIPVLQIVALGVPYRAATLVMLPLVNGIGRPEVTLKNTLTTAAVVPAALLFGVHWGLIGLCIGSVVGLLVAVTINAYRTIVTVGASYGELLAACSPSIVSAAVMYAAVAGAQVLLLAEWRAIDRLIALVSIGVVVYAAMTLALNRPAATRSMQVISGAV